MVHVFVCHKRHFLVTRSFVSGTPLLDLKDVINVKESSPAFLASSCLISSWSKWKSASSLSAGLYKVILLFLAFFRVKHTLSIAVPWARGSGWLPQATDFTSLAPYSPCICSSHCHRSQMPAAKVMWEGHITSPLGGGRIFLVFTKCKYVDS